MGNLGESNVVCNENIIEKLNHSKFNLECDYGVLKSIGAIGLNKKGDPNCVIQQIKNEYVKNNIRSSRNEYYVEFDSVCTSYK